MVCAASFGWIGVECRQTDVCLILRKLHGKLDSTGNIEVAHRLTFLMGSRKIQIIKYQLGWKDCSTEGVLGRIGLVRLVIHRQHLPDRHRKGR